MAVITGNVIKRKWVRAVWAMLCLSMPAVAMPAAETPINWVNPYIGTAGSGSEYGGTMPLVTTPFGMTNWTPQTRQNRVGVSSYNFGDTQIQGFIGTHQPAIWMGDYGYVTLMPELGEARYAPEARKLPFSRKDEIAKPDYYAVTMQAGAGRQIRAELTATDHCGYLRFWYPKAGEAGVLVEATRPGVRGYVEVDEARHEVRGYNPDRQDAGLGPLALPNFKGYFVVRFRQPFAATQVYRDAQKVAGRGDIEGTNVGAFVSFDASSGEPIEAQVGTSFISIAQAEANLDVELPQWDFDAQRQSLKNTWNDTLGLITIDGANADQRRIFYTALYHALLYPRLFSEHGRYYSAFDDQVHPGVSYTDYSIWDTFRAENSLLTLIAPERVNDMVQALLQDYREGGWMPKWPNPSYTNIMIGTHADSLVAEAITKGFHGFDWQLAYEAVHKDATTPPDGDVTRRWRDREPHTPYEARAGLTYALKLGYIPADKVAEAASSTLEEAYDDYAVARVAQATGHADDYAYFLQRAANYRLLFNPARGFMQARRADGSWASPKDGWTEGDEWTYLFAALHDIPGTVELIGGSSAAEAKLDAHFHGGHNHHDNEPSHHYGYLYDFTGSPWKTQDRVRAIAADAYSNTPGGILGNEDCGQMSAWYVFSAMGFYPLNPASGEYMIGSPMFTHLALKLDNGKTFVVNASNNSRDNVYIQSATLNGQPLDEPVVRYEQIMAGGTLEFVMGPRPSRWAAQWRPQPLAP
ncbi:glycoside hydrolase family 92 protein [Dyella solisilvae]|uniref:Glycoside hydrolase family 92 protein n=1 Tax=Dyella solisilvae TaxID=1920168 RepID=A0A370K7Q9_9GAMM|nr:GH92 family glycosyl hydrolase [Dyella solisilvae]RDI98688.1 glycoside hydrolase family 92 protein [Dyella solisilvae]